LYLFLINAIFVGVYFHKVVRSHRTLYGFLIKQIVVVVHS